MTPGYTARRRAAASRRVATRERHREMVAAYLACGSTYDVADRFGVSPGLVAYALRKADVPLRRPGRPRLVAETWGVVLPHVPVRPPQREGEGGQG